MAGEKTELKKTEPKVEELDPAEVAEHGDPELGEGELAGKGDAEPELDLDGETKDDAEKPEAKAEPETAKGDAKDDEEKPEGDDDKPLTPEETKQLRGAVKALTKRLGTVSAEKRQISEKLQQTLKPVEPVTADAEADKPERKDFASKAEFDAAVAVEAARVRAVEKFNSQCNEVEDKGSKAFGRKWTDAKAQLAILDDNGRIPMDLLSCALETDNPAQVLYALGQNIEKAGEMLAMTPIKRAIAMSKIADAKPAQPERQRSQAPDPEEPISGRGGRNDTPSDRDSDAEWHRKEAIREAEQRRKRLAG